MPGNVSASTFFELGATVKPRYYSIASVSTCDEATNSVNLDLVVSKLVLDPVPGDLCMTFGLYGLWPVAGGPWLVIGGWLLMAGGLRLEACDWWLMAFWPAAGGWRPFASVLRLVACGWWLKACGL